MKWGILGAGRIADAFLAELQVVSPGTVLGVASADHARAEALAARHGVTAYASYDELLADPAIGAVYIATVHPQHAALIDAALAAGKHILCEKPVTMDAVQAQAAYDRAAAAGLQLLEAVQFRFQPQTRELQRMITAGTIGTLLHIDVSVSFFAPFDATDRVFDPAIGGSAILDVGIYSMSFALMVAGWTAGAEAVEPTSFTGGGHAAPTGVDDWAVAQLAFASGFTASVRSGSRLDEPMVAVLHGTGGRIFVGNPWVPGKDGEPPSFVVSRAGEAPQTVVCAAEPLFAAEVEALEAAVASGEPAGLTPAETLVSMRALDRWRGLVAQNGRS